MPRQYRLSTASAYSIYEMYSEDWSALPGHDGDDKDDSEAGANRLLCLDHADAVSKNSTAQKKFRKHLVPVSPAKLSCLYFVLCRVELEASPCTWCQHGFAAAWASQGSRKQSRAPHYLVMSNDVHRVVDISVPGQVPIAPEDHAELEAALLGDVWGIPPPFRNLLKSLWLGLVAISTSRFMAWPGCHFHKQASQDVLYVLDATCMIRCWTHYETQQNQAHARYPNWVVQGPPSLV
eukprot:s3170_g2.t1